MGIDKCLILAAGYGTRMGKIGKIIPKVLWPIFEKTLLELQICYARSLGIKKIYINLHFKHKEITNFLEKTGLDSKVFISCETELLDIGGAIHQIARRPEVDYNGNLLVINSDQFLFFDFNILHDTFALRNDFSALLFGLEVYGQNDYSELIIDSKNQLIDICEYSRKLNYLMFSGLSVVNLFNLKRSKGASSYFRTVANYLQERVIVKNLKRYEYWDFGTLSRYKEAIRKILKQQIESTNSSFINFCLKYDVFNQEKINGDTFSYGSDSDHSVVLKVYDGKAMILAKDMIIYEKLEESL